MFDPSATLSEFTFYSSSIKGGFFGADGSLVTIFTFYSSSIKGD